MRIEIPHSAHPITRVNVLTPQGTISADFTLDHKFFDVELAEGVTEDEVGIFVQYLNNGNKPVDSVTLKVGIEKPIDPPATPADPPADDCECGEKEACSNCDPEDEIAEPKDESSDE